MNLFKDQDNNEHKIKERLQFDATTLSRKKKKKL